jgi:hypothetical protein
MTEGVIVKETGICQRKMRLVKSSYSRSCVTESKLSNVLTQPVASTHEVKGDSPPTSGD